MSADSELVVPRKITTEITLWDLWQTVWDGKVLIILITGLFTSLAVAYALLATEWYRGSTLLMAAEDQTMKDIGGDLSGLAAIAGISTGGGSRKKAESVAVLRSKQFARDFIEDYNLLEKFLEPDEEFEGELDVREAVRFFHETVLSIGEDRDTGQVLLSVDWKDPVTAADWANVLAARLNQVMRERASTEAEANIAFLRSEMATNNVVALEESISRIMESEMQKLMLARGREEFAFQVIDVAEPPLVRSRPRRSLLVISVFVVSGIFSVLIVFMRNAIRNRKMELAST